jgi:hypothetical protein
VKNGNAVAVKVLMIGEAGKRALQNQNNNNLFLLKVFYWNARLPFYHYYFLTEKRKDDVSQPVLRRKSRPLRKQPQAPALPFCSKGSYKRLQNRNQLQNAGICNGGIKDNFSTGVKGNVVANWACFVDDYMQTEK